MNEQSEENGSADQTVPAQEGAASAKPSAPATPDIVPPLSQEDLRRIAEAVRSKFPRPFTRCELVLIDVDPWHIHAFWNIPLAYADRVVRDSDLAKGSLPLVLRVSELEEAGSPGSAFDIEVLGLQGQYYIDIWGENRRYRGAIGYRRPDGTLIPLAAAADVILPPVAPSTEVRYSESTVSPPEHGHAVAAMVEPRQEAAEEVERLAEVGPPVSAVASPPEEMPAAHPSEEILATAGPTAEPAVATESLPLPLEQVLTLSSFALGREDVQFELNAELHIFGRARPGARLMLFGRPVALRPDGTFSITRPLPDGALVLSALLAEAGPSQE